MTAGVFDYTKFAISSIVSSLVFPEELDVLGYTERIVSNKIRV